MESILSGCINACITACFCLYLRGHLKYSLNSINTSGVNIYIRTIMYTVLVYYRTMYIVQLNVWICMYVQYVCMHIPYIYGCIFLSVHSIYTVHPESIHSASLFPHFVLLALFQNGLKFSFSPQNSTHITP